MPSPPRVAAVLAACTISLGVGGAVTGTAGAAEPTADPSPWGQTPGSYSDWTADTSEPIRNVNFRNTVLTTPGNGNVYWSNQFSFDGNGSYLGFQSAGQNDGQFLWSTWGDADLEFRNGTHGSVCWNNTGEGQHLQCSNKTVGSGRPITGHTYSFRVAIDPSTHWASATVQDETDGTSFVLGEARLPASSKINPQWSSWVEYFDWNNSRFTCRDNAYSKNEWGPTTANDSTVTARNTGTSTSSTCQDMVRQVRSDDGRRVTTELGLGQSARWPMRFANGACLDRGGSTGAITWPCSQTSNGNQLFLLAGDGSLRTAHGNECVAAPASAGGQVGLAACDGSAAQRWRYDAQRRVVVGANDWVLTSSASGGANDPVTARPYTGRAAQVVAPATATSDPPPSVPPATFPAGYHQLAVSSSGQCVDVTGWRTDDVAPVGQWDCKTSTPAGNQRFSFTPGADGYGDLVVEHSGKAVVVENAVDSPGGRIVQWAANGSPNGRWLPIALPDGSWQFRNRHSGLCLDMPANSTTRGTQFTQWTCKADAAGSNQAFVLR